LSSSYDVLVVGAGPAGSATATLLARDGFTVCLLDRQRFPRPKPCAEYVSPGAVRILDRLGVRAALEADRPAELRGMRIVGSDGTGFEGRYVEGVGLGLPRERLDLHLARAAARGAELREGATFRAARPGPGGGIIAVVRAGAATVEIGARLLVGADGLNSRVARELGLARLGSLRRVALVGHLAGVAGMGDLGEMHLGPLGYVGLASIGGGVTNVAMVIALERARPAPPLEESFRRLLGTFPTVRQRVAHAELVSAVRGTGPFGRTTRRASATSALLVGDAADFYDPFTGEGVYTALRGAELAAECAATALRADRLGATELSAYDRVRRSEFAGKWTLERIVGWVVARPLAFAHVARRLAAEPALADQLVSATAHVAPPASVLRPSYAWRLVR
jgi:flavin-dependent dehydrogenase